MQGAVRNLLPEQDEFDPQSASAVFKTLANPYRVQVLHELRGAELNVTELTRRLGCRQATLSQQLARLREEGFVQARRNGKEIYYSLDRAGARPALRALSALQDD